MRVIHLNHSDISGGAARAAFRIHHSLRDAGVDSRMWVNKATAGDWTVDGPPTKVAKALAAVRGHAARPLVKTFKAGNPIIHSPAILPSQWVKRINASDADIVHLHWVQGEMLSIADIGRIRKPIVWTLHDMWAFCGAEHYTEDHRWRDGYRRDNRPAHESGFDLNRWTWQRKRKHWQQPIPIVTPSQWLADCARDSALMRDWPVSVVANPIDTERWKPLEQALARELLGLPADVPLVLFGAMGGGRDPRKGFDLLMQALEHLGSDPRANGMELVVFGQLSPQSPSDLGFPIHYTGHLHDDLSLRALYSAADAMVIPSRQDNLPNTGVEAHACATPVIAFHTGGLPDIVDHQRTGYLAQAFDTEDLAKSIAFVLDQRKTEPSGDQAREKALKQFSYEVVAPQYMAVYETALENGRS
ncbi:glycosyltransferase family 4 protein [Spiribacter salinus]|uniref:glycosyltransferase family 4 protein n=1 Tax=Spiribacter salinus TaxID=1335746 RepID=UPI001C983D84|nr:glycosyltransferase family 4 protein [Spiribacter salinus]MBY5267712.1 glycosyl transferase [Spiribacter salinus]